MLDSKPQKNHRGFTLLELLIVVVVIAVLGAMTVPRMMTAVNDISLRYVATGFSGLLQSARMQAVKQNTFYSIQAGTDGSGAPIYYIAKPTQAYAAGDIILPLNPNVTVWQGPGSGAPNETAFLANLLFTVDANNGDAPSFSSRGLPCVGAANSCTAVLGQGFVLFVSKPGIIGNVPWASVVVNPSGHIQIWTCDVAGTWIQRD